MAALLARHWDNGFYRYATESVGGCSYPGWPFRLRLWWRDINGFWQAELSNSTIEPAGEGEFARDPVQIDWNAPHV
ncbi:MAG: hypothetical protein Q6M04_02515 [Thermostichus sp. BF3_bins_97]